MAGLYDRVVGIISKPPERREEREVIDLLPWFKKKSELFRSLEKDVILDLIRNCQFSAVDRDAVVIRQGDKGDSFFVILRGVVSVYVNTDISDKDEEIKEELPALRYNELGILDRKQFGQELNSLESGKAFGELALINDSCVRNASIIADDRTDLLVVNRELFNRSLCSAQAADFASRTKFAQEHPLFRHWATKHKRQLAMSIRREKMNFDQSIVKQGDVSNAMYFLIKGQGKVTVDSNYHRLQFPQFLQSEEQERKTSSEDFIDEDRNKKLERSKTEYSESSLSEQRRKAVHRKRVEVSVVGVNEILGDIEFVLDLKSYVYSVVCMQDCELFSLNAQNFDRLVTRRNPKTVEHLRDCAQLKLFARLSRFQDNELPLLKTLLEKLEEKRKPKNGQKRPVFATKPDFRRGNTGSQFLFPRGPVIDKYGPGTVFYRNKVRQEAKQKREQKKKQSTTPRIAFTNRGGAFGSNVSSPVIEVPMVFGRTRASGERIEDSFHSQFPFQETEFEDNETSDEALRVLEERIRTWHEAVTAKTEPLNKDYTKLHRCNTEQNMTLVPGTKVIIRKRPLEFKVDFAREQFESLVFHSPDSRDFLFPESARDCINSSFVDDAERGVASLSTRSRNNLSETSTQDKKGNGNRNYTAAEYTMLKKHLFKCQREMIKYGMFY